MSVFDTIKVKLGMAAPHMKPVDVPPWGEFGWVVDQWYRLGSFWRTSFFLMTGVALAGWGLFGYSYLSKQPIPRSIQTTLFDHGGVVAVYTTNQGEEPPNKVREAKVKEVFFRMRRIPGSIDAVADNLKDLTAYLGKPAESKTRACLAAHPVEEMVDQNIRREVLNMRYVPGRLNAAAVSLYWTEIERDQLENVRSRRDVEATATVRLGNQCDADKNPHCLIIEEFSWSIPDC